MPVVESAPEQAQADRIAELRASLPKEYTDALTERYGAGRSQASDPPAKESDPVPADDPPEDPPNDDDAIVAPEGDEPPPAAATSTTNTPAPGATAKAATATPASASPKGPVEPPAPWQPDEVVRQVARSRGIDEGVVARGFRSDADFYRALMLHDLQTQAQQKTAATQTQAPPSALQSFLDDPTQDPDQKAAIKEMHDQLVQSRQQLEQLSQGSQQFAQAQQQRAHQEFIGRFDAVLDELADDFIGKRATATQEQMQRRSEVYDSLAILMQHGKATEVNRGSLMRAFSLAFPEQSQQHLRRTQVADARSQANNRVGAGRTSGKPSASAPSDPGGLTPKQLANAKAAGIPAY